MMIDLHSHILDGIDDGAKTIEDSLDLCRAAVDEGITDILATPHHKNRHWINPSSVVVPKVNYLNELLQEQNIPLKVYPGQEVRIYGDMVRDIKNGELLTVGEEHPYILIEFSFSQVPSYTERLFYDIQMMGVTPIIVHPERIQPIADDPDMLIPFIESGALTQLTAGSLTGAFGKDTEEVSRRMIEADLIHFIASDAHSIDKRPFRMRESFGVLERDYGRAMVNRYLGVAEKILAGEFVYTPQPKKIEKPKKSWFGKLFGK